MAIQPIPSRRLPELPRLSWCAGYWQDIVYMAETKKPGSVLIEYSVEPAVQGFSRTTPIPQFKQDIVQLGESLSGQVGHTHSRAVVGRGVIFCRNTATRSNDSVEHQVDFVPDWIFNETRRLTDVHIGKRATGVNSSGLQSTADQVAGLRYNLAK